MVANIRSGPSPSGALYYNKENVDKDEAEVLLWQKMLEPFDKHGRMDIDACVDSFRPCIGFLIANDGVGGTLCRHVIFAMDIAVNDSIEGCSLVGCFTIIAQENSSESNEEIAYRKVLTLRVPIIDVFEDFLQAVGFSGVL